MSQDRDARVSRRRFVTLSAALAGAGLAGCGARGPDHGSGGLEEAASAEKPTVVRYRRLGRTGFRASDVSSGGAATDANVFRYANDLGVNYFDTAETYGNGDSERKLGEALQHMDRGKVFVTTKLVVVAEDSEDGLVERFGKCQERLRLETVDALFMHSVTDLGLLDHAGFHGAVARLKADGRLRFAGLSSHGPRGEDGDSMEKVLVTAAEDGRFDLMLLVYNYLNQEAGRRVLASCAARDVGTTAMKTAPATLDIEPYDPDHPTTDHAAAIARMVERGMSEEDAEQRIRDWVAEQEATLEEARPFLAEHGVDTAEELRRTSVRWVLQDDRMHTVCLGWRSFDDVTAGVALSGSALDRRADAALAAIRSGWSSRYCRHGCTGCVAACPQRLPVSTIMRYAYYFDAQRREKEAMTKYARLAGRDASPCAGCAAPCVGACPYRVNVQAQLLRAHSLLTLA